MGSRRFRGPAEEGLVRGYTLALIHDTEGVVKEWPVIVPFAGRQLKTEVYEALVKHQKELYDRAMRELEGKPDSTEPGSQGEENDAI